MRDLGPWCDALPASTSVLRQRRMTEENARSGRSLGTLLLLVAMTAAGNAPSVAKSSSPGVYEGHSSKLYSERVRTSRFVTVRDGTRLAVDIYRPSRDGVAVETRHPVIWAMTPYRRGFLKDGQVALSGGLQRWDVRELTDYGYVVVIADARGKGASFGSRRGMTDTSEGVDGYDLTEWLAVQPWSTGKIGMTGCSYVGGTQWATLTQTPPSLTAIFPGAATFSRYDFVSRGGMTAQYHTRPEQPDIDDGEGTLPVDEDKDGRLLAEARQGHKFNTPMAEIWKAIPFRDDWSPLMKSRYWEEISVSTFRNRIEQSGVAIYGWSSWQDEFSGDQFLHKANLRNPMKVLMLGGEHCAVDGFDMAAEQHRFFDYWLKGIDNGIMAEPPIHYFTYNAPTGREWRSAKAWPLPQMRYRSYYLASDIVQGKATPGTVGLSETLPT
uniref:CocE/NonD family hydrolase n=1 Tax=Polymorphobacter sp. TaxID=1909290 RepID=UPI003F71D4FB